MEAGRTVKAVFFSGESAMCLVADGLSENWENGGAMFGQSHQIHPPGPQGGVCSCTYRT